MSKTIYILLLLLTIIKSFVFPINDIENKEEKKDFISRAYNLTSMSQLNSFFNQKKNIFLYFFADFCSGCKELLTSFNKASSYESVYNSTNIILIDCSKYRDICFNYNIDVLPSLKIYYIHPEYNNYTLINYTFYSFEFNDVIKLIQKISNIGTSYKYKGLIKLKNQKDINKFSNNLGDVSFVLILDKKNKIQNKNILYCYNNDIALNSEFISKFYFGYGYINNNNKIKKENDNIKYPLLYMTGINYNDFNLNIEIDTCDDIINFIKNNELPIFKNFDNKYLFKLLRMKKTIFIFNIDKKKLSSIPRLISSIQKYLIERRDLIFGYLDINEDKSMLEFFNIKKQIINTTIIIYDFNKGKYYLSEYNNIESLEKLIQDYDMNKLEWKSGYFLEDFLSGTLGININRNYLIFFFMLIFSLIIIFGCIFCFQTFERIDKKLK
jgi:thiol-disulfide isomerase/thioredoxin